MVRTHLRIFLSISNHVSLSLKYLQSSYNPPYHHLHHTDKRRQCGPAGSQAWKLILRPCIHHSIYPLSCSQTVGFSEWWQDSSGCKYKQKRQFEVFRFFIYLMFLFILMNVSYGKTGDKEATWRKRRYLSWHKKEFKYLCK